MLDSRTLISNMLARGPIDRIGLHEGFWDETMHKWVEQGYPTQTVEKDGAERQEPVDPFHFFDFDLHRCGGFFDTEPILGPEEILEQTDEWEIRRNGAGATLKWWKHKSGTPEHIDFQMSSREIWERDYRPHLLQVDPRRFNGKWWGNNSLEEDKRELALARSRGQWAWFGHVFVWEVMRASMGDLAMYENLLLDPGWVHDFNRTYTDFFKDHFRVIFSEMGLPDGAWLYDDIAYNMGMFASPKTFRELFLPYYVEMVDFFHGYDLPVLFHSDGNVNQALPLIREAGFVGYNPMERKAGVDPISLAKTYGRDFIYIGGFDVRIFETNDRAVVEREMVALLNTMKSLEVGYVFGSDHTITPRVDYDTYRFALDVYREHMLF